jgi:DNA-binding NarL/FixJ family response regulator
MLADLTGHAARFRQQSESPNESVRHIRPDVVMLDIRMPGTDGIVALRAIKARRPHLPVILNTAYEAYKGDFGSWACDAYIVKSSDLTELKAEIRQVSSRATTR